MASHSSFASGKGSNGLLSRIGNTPLVRLRSIAGSLPEQVELYAKLEWFNPGGSVKDRAALNMIERGEQSGHLCQDKTILDATSGNTGIAYAMIGAAKGYQVLLCVSENISPERKKILRSYGAELILTDPNESSDGAIRRAREIYGESPERFFYPDQYNNEANWQAHFESTGPEIYSQTDKRVTHFVAGLGTSGTFVGTARRLKAYNQTVQAISFQPDSGFHGLEGLKHMPTAIIPGIYDAELADRNMEIDTEEAYAMVVQLARKEGLLAGISSGAAAVCALRVAGSLDQGVVVTVFPDGGDRYLSESFWQEY